MPRLSIKTSTGNLNLFLIFTSCIITLHRKYTYMKAKNDTHVDVNYVMIADCSIKTVAANNPIRRKYMVKMLQQMSPNELVLKFVYTLKDANGDVSHTLASIACMNMEMTTILFRLDL